jgi:hypothetical protein
MTVDRVSVSWPHIERQLEVNGHDRVHLVFVVQDGDPRPPEAALAAVTAAAIVANGEYGSTDVQAQANASPSPHGPVVELDWVGTEESTRAWLARFAGYLAAEGWAGMVGSSPQARIPAWDLLLRPKVALFAAYPIVGIEAAGPPVAAELSGWGVDHELTLAACRQLLEWAGHDDSELYLQQGRSQVQYRSDRARVHRGDLAGYLTWSLAHSQGVSVYGVQRNLAGIRHGSLKARGEAVYELEAEPALSPLEHVRRLRQLLAAPGQPYDLAFMRLVPSLGGSWRDLARDTIGPHGLTLRMFARHRHLWSRHVPDAHALQVLTAAHLERAADLSRWSVTEVGDGRFLVEAPDLVPWFASQQTDPAVLAAARDDFGDMLLTPEVIAANPA